MEKEFFDKLIESFKNASISSGRNKEPDDFTILHEYVERYGSKPSMLRITNGDTEYFKLDKLLTIINKEFKDNDIIYNDQYYSNKYSKIITNKQVIKLEDGYICDLTIQITDDIIESENYTKSGLKDNDELVTDVKILIPSKSDKLIIEKIIKVFKKSIIDCKNKRIIIEMIAMDRGELYTENFYLDDNFVDMQFPDLHYGEGFEVFYDKLLKKLQKDTKGLVLLHGVPGSGKTVLIRQLLKDLTKEDANILYFSPMMVSSITDPSFINFITNWATGNDNKKGILLIEDADPLLETRSNGRNIGISNLLNLTDGLLNDILKIQIIATFNTKISNLDEALLRPERLIARKEFKSLPKVDVYKLIEAVEISKEKVDKYFADNPKVCEMTLAEIYALKKDNEIIEHDVKTKDKKMGF